MYTNALHHKQLHHNDYKIMLVTTLYTALEVEDSSQGSYQLALNYNSVFTPINNYSKYLHGENLTTQDQDYVANSCNNYWN